MSDAAAPFLPPELPPPSPAAPPPDVRWPGELDSEYECVAELGRGGMAIVYRARDKELGREVAIKVMRTRHTQDHEAVARLAREARTVARLEHPHIVALHAVKRLSDDSLALVMQLVPGKTLKQTLKHEGAFTPDRVERVLRDIARALAYAHARGIVHRDVTPENIFLDAASGRALLSDFGIAISREADTSLTAAGAAIGTPTYMSPEQIDGAHVDCRSDLYSLGLVAWEMLTGRRPWDGESLYSVIYRQKHEELAPIEEFRPDVSERVRYLIDGLLRKQPASRWVSAERFLARLNDASDPPGLKPWRQYKRKQAKVRRELANAPPNEAAPLEALTQPFRRSAEQRGITDDKLDAGSSRQTIRVETSASAVDEWRVEDDGSTTQRRPYAKWAAAAAVLLVGGAAALLLSNRPPQRPADTRSSTIADAGTIEVPTLKNDSIAHVDSVSAAVLRAAKTAGAASIRAGLMPNPRTPTTTPAVVPPAVSQPAQRDTASTSPNDMPTVPTLAFPPERTLVGGGQLPAADQAQWRSVAPPPPCAGSLGLLTASAGGSSAVKEQLPDPPLEVDLAVITLYVRSVPGGERYLADALADHFAYQLARQTGITVATREGIRRAPPSQGQQSVETARTLHTRFLLSGAIQGSSGGTRLTMTLYDAKTAKTAWQEQYPISSRTALDIARSVHSNVAARIRGRNPESVPPVQGGTNVPDAFEQFLRGLDADRERSQRYYRRAIDFFREATRLDPRFAEAHARLALTVSRSLEAGLTEFDASPEALLVEGQKAADRAVELDSTFALAWLGRGSLLSFSGMTPAARESYRRAATLDPRDPEIAWQEANSLLRAGRRSEGEKRLQHAVSLSRRYAPAFTELAVLALVARRPDTACDWLNYAITADPFAATPYALRSVARQRDGELRLAWADAEIATRLGRRLLGDAAASLVDLTARDSTKARARARWAGRELERRSRLSQLEARFLATLFVRLGDRERALKAIDKAFPRDRYLALLLQDEVFAPIARDQRFQRATRLTQ